MKPKKVTLTISISETAYDALVALTLVDMRSKSQQIEYVVIDHTERRAAEQKNKNLVRGGSVMNVPAPFLITNDGAQK
jgi:hypothetical protein